MTDEQLKFLTTHICNQTTTLAKRLTTTTATIALHDPVAVAEAPELLYLV
jgi:hypothetical protein